MEGREEEEKEEEGKEEEEEEAKAKTKAAYTCWDVPDIPKNSFFFMDFSGAPRDGSARKWVAGIGAKPAAPVHLAESDRHIGTVPISGRGVPRIVEP